MNSVCILSFLPMRTTVKHLLRFFFCCHTQTDGFENCTQSAVYYCCYNNFTSFIVHIAVVISIIKASVTCNSNFDTSLVNYLILSERSSMLASTIKDSISAVRYKKAKNTNFG